MSATWRAAFSPNAGARRLLDLYGLTAFLRLAPLDDRGLFMRTLDRPVKAGDPIGVAHLQVPFLFTQIEVAFRNRLAGPEIADSGCI